VENDKKCLNLIRAYLQNMILNQEAARKAKRTKEFDAISAQIDAVQTTLTTLGGKTLFFSITSVEPVFITIWPCSNNTNCQNDKRH